MAFMAGLMRNLSRGVVKEEKEFELIGNCFGFYGLSGGVGTSTLCMEVGLLASENKLHTCIVDCSPLSTFYLNKLMRTLDEKDIKDIPSINKRFTKRSCNIAECLIGVNDYLKVMCFGDSQYSDSFSMDLTIVRETFQELKDVFDLVILDIPHLPWSEPTIVGLEVSSRVFTLWNFSTDNILKRIKTDNLYALAGLDWKMNNTIIMNTPIDVSIKSSLDGIVNGDVLFECPYVPTLRKAALSNLSVLGSIRGREAIKYGKCLDFIFGEITNGISGKDEAINESQHKRGVK